MTASTVDLAVIAAYLAGVTLFGCSFYFRKKGGASAADDFTKGGGKLPAWALALSVFATYVSSISFLALPAKAYLTNWNALVLSFSIPFAATAAAIWFVPFYRRQTSASAYSFLEARFGTWARIYASGCFLAMQSVRSGMILFLLALLLDTLMGFPIPQTIAVVGVATMLYSMLGGIRAVVWTDAVQAIVLIAGALVCVAVLGGTLPGGLAAGVASAWDAGKFSLGSFSWTDWGRETFWVTFVYGVFLNLQNFGIDQSYTQRYVAAKSRRAAVRAMFSGAMLYLPVSFVFVAIGALLWIWVQANPGVVPAAVLAKSDAVFPWFIVHRLPVGVSGLLVAAIVAAAMSTVSTTLNSGATVLLEDYRKRFARQPVGHGAQILFLRLATVGLGLFSIGVALGVMRVTSVLTTWWALQSVLSGGMLGLFLLGVFAKRTRRAQALVATLVGIVAVAWIVFGPKVFHVSAFLHVNLAMVVGTLALVVTGFALAACARRPRAVILGCGRSGEAAADLLAAEGWTCEMLDGADELPDGRFALAVVSPGVPLTHHWIAECRRRGIPCRSELEVGVRALRRRGVRMIAVTGSKGKSSVVKAIATALNRAGLSVAPCGNYGRPVCDVARGRARPAWAIVEVSSFQMETTALPSDAFEAAAILNLQEDHLDRHGSVETYHALKRKLLTMAKVRLVPEDLSAPDASKDDALFAGSYFDNAVLCGNGRAAVRILRAAGLSDAAIAAGFAAFEPLPHRMNLVGTFGGVRCVDDSKATSLAALAAGVRMTPGPVRLVAGGLPKGDDPKAVLGDLTGKVKKVYLIGRCAEAFAAAWSASVDCEVCGTMDVAVAAAMRDAQPGETVLLSPGTASFDQFKSYGERGEVFARLVQEEGQKKT